MNKIDLGQTVQTLANVGVIAGIVFLAFEIQQNTEMTRAQITQSRADTAVALAEAYFDSEYIPAIRQKISQGDELSGEEVSRYETWLRATLRNQDNNFQQYSQGLLRDYIPRNAAGVVNGVLIGDEPYGLAYWENSKDIYSDEFVVFVDEVIHTSRERQQ